MINKNQTQTDDSDINDMDDNIEFNYSNSISEYDSEDLNWMEFESPQNQCELMAQGLETGREKIQARFSTPWKISNFKFPLYRITPSISDGNNSK